MLLHTLSKNAKNKMLWILKLLGSKINFPIQMSIMPLSEGGSTNTNMMQPTRLSILCVPLVSNCPHKICSLHSCLRLMTKEWVFSMHYIVIELPFFLSTKKGTYFAPLRWREIQSFVFCKLHTIGTNTIVHNPHIRFHFHRTQMLCHITKSVTYIKTKCFN